RIFILTKHDSNSSIEKLNINTVGLYFANQGDNSLRLTIEGTQLIGPLATKNVIEIRKEEVQPWMRGESLNKTIQETEFVIIKYGKDYLGSGRKSNDTIANFIPKSRRIKSYREAEMLD
ncbi:MAG: hypothetical protein FD122_3773, partial [Stygiobacter sp.]